MKFVLFCIFLVSLGQASLMERYPQNITRRSIMSVMMEVEAKLKTNSPLDGILSVLEEFE